MPEATLAPAPAAAPAPTPAAPAAPAKPAAPSTPAVTAAKPVSKPANNMADAYDQLDRMGAPEEPADHAPAPAGDEPDPAAAAGDEPDPAAPPTDQTTQKPVKAATLRTLLDQTKADLVKSQARVKELETKTASPADDPEKVKLTETLKQREARLAELDEELRHTNYERSQEYKEKYETPYVETYQNGRDWTSKLQVVSRVDAETGEVTRQARQATPADFDNIMSAFVNDPLKGSQMMTDMFGEQALSVMYHAQETLKLNRTRLSALENQRKLGADREKNRSAAAQKENEETAKVFNSEIEEAGKKYKFFQPQDGDVEGNELLEKGSTLAKLAFGLPVKDENGQPIKLSRKEMAKLHAAMYNKAAAFDRQVYLVRKQNAQIKQLQKQLADFEKSVPGGGTRRPGGKPAMSAWDSVDQQLQQLAR